LSGGAYFAEVLPAAGGRISRLSWAGGGSKIELLVPITVDRYEAHDWPKGGAFPMVPFANRLPAGTVQSGNYGSRPATGPEGVALHGIAHRRVWRVVALAKNSIEMEYVHSDTQEWRWPWRAKLCLELGDAGATMRMEATNLSSLPAPLALGWHPYFCVPADFRSADLRFNASQRQELDACGTAMLERPLPPIFDMSRRSTQFFSGWKGEAEFRVATGHVLSVSCEGTQQMVIHRPATGDYLCLEPVTEAPGWMGNPQYIARRLAAAGETRSFTVTCRLK